MEAARSRAESPEESSTDAPGDPERVVLIVEDEPVLRASMARGLSKLSDLEVVVAGNLAEGRKLLAALRPSVLVLDLHLPDGSGLGLLSEVERHRISAAIIFVTAYPQKLHGQLPERSDVRVLEKPVPMAQLRDTVLAAFESMGVRSSSPSPFSLADYLQLAGYSRRTVRIEVHRDGERLGSVWVKDGDGFHADDAKGQGLRAFQRLLQAPDVTIACHAITGEPGVPRTLDQSCEELLLSSTRILDERAYAAANGMDEAGWEDLDLDDLTPGQEPSPLAAPEAPSPAAPRPYEPALPTPRSGIQAVGVETFEQLWARGVEALLSRSYEDAYTAFRAAEKLGSTPGLVANLSRLRAMGYGS